ncbi:MAG: hypothetical protein AAGA95_17650 [Pseudomonadota bacterium]
MSWLIRALVVLVSVLLIYMGAGWYVNPESAAEGLGMALQDGVGRSSQIGDTAALFITTGSCALIGMVSRQRIWFYPAAMLMCLTALGRLLAWLLHDAAFATELIAAELVFATIFLVASRKLTSA